MKGQSAARKPSPSSFFAEPLHVLRGVRRHERLNAKLFNFQLQRHRITRRLADDPLHRPSVSIPDGSDDSTHSQCSSNRASAHL